MTTDDVMKKKDWFCVMMDSLFTSLILKDFPLKPKLSICRMGKIYRRVVNKKKWYPITCNPIWLHDFVEHPRRQNTYRIRKTTYGSSKMLKNTVFIVVPTRAEAENFIKVWGKTIWNILAEGIISMRKEKHMWFRRKQKILDELMKRKKNNITKEKKQFHEISKRNERDLDLFLPDD